MKKTKTSLLHSGLALLLCISMLIGSTYAWFSDSISSGKNIITAGNLDLEMYWTDDLNSGKWHNVEENGYNTIFNYDNWEPGYTDVKYIKLVNAGDLALNYKLALTPQNGVGKLAEVINVYFAEGGVAVEQRSDLQNLQAIGLLNNVLNGGATADGTLLAADQYSPLHPSGEIVMTLAMNMLTTAGNEYQNEDAGMFSITALATQAPFEMDSFGSDYDANAEYPTVLTAGSATTTVTPVDNKVPAGGVMLNGGSISAFVPEGVALEAGTTELTLTVTPLKNTTSDIVVVNDEVLIPVDVHIDGVAEDNTIPIVIDLGEILPKYLNMGNYHLYHVENGSNSVMTLVADKAALVGHNQFTYDPLTGAVSVAMASFSEVTILADTAAKWEGGEDNSWYNTTATELYIANADQLYSFAKIVGGMDADYAQDSFAGKTVKLLSDINLNHGTVVDNGIKTIFYPVGYYNSEGANHYDDKTNVAINSGFYTFEGVFDGAGHTISNIYQNTWEMKGDHNWYAPEDQHYRDGMGLFGKVYGGTVKNLTVDNFESDGEITTTGVIASYADYGATFENIAITNCNPRVYNIGNGGIVGCVGWYTKDVTNKVVTFKNITVDNSNIISALWGSYDVACGGIVGQYYPTSGQSSANYPANPGIHFENCHVAAVMDVYNDVCANYQYYAYRYAGMMIGSIRENETIDGHVYPKMDGITATGCTVHYETWNDYYYCELVANSLASYTHDHQFSRLERVEKVDGTTITRLDLSTFTVPSSGRYNYVVVNGEFSTENATCYHFVDGEVWTHDMASTETVNGEIVLKEDKQHYYLPFNQLFTGYGWGVTSKGLADFEGIETMDITASNQKDSVEKFKAKDNIDLSEIKSGDSVAISDLFEAVSTEVDIKSDTVMVAVTDLTKTHITADFVRGNTWDKGELKFNFNGTGGYVKITIQDYYFCKPTSIIVKVGDFATTDRFAVVFPNADKYLYRVGNQNNISISSLFKDINEGIGNVSVDVETINGNVTSTYTSNEAWLNGTLKFNGTGVVNITISDDNFSTPVTLPVEVVNATNVTAYNGLGNRNSVLLNDITMSSGSSYYLSGATLYGNGFTFDMTDGTYAAGGNTSSNYVFGLNNANIDNVKIVGAVYTTYGATVQSEYNRAAVLSTGNSTIVNSYISNCASAVRVKDGNLEIVNSTVKGGNFANIDIRGGHVILDNVTTINQVNGNDTAKDGTVVVGLGVVVYYENVLNTTTIEVKNGINQYNYLSKSQADTYIKDSTAKNLTSAMFSSSYTAVQYNDGSDTWVNAGILSMIDTVGDGNVSDVDGYVDASPTMTGVTGYLHTKKPDAASIAATIPTYATTGQGAIAPSYSFDYTSKNYVAKVDGSNDFCYEDGGTVYISMDEGDTFNWDTSILTATKNSQKLDYTVSMNGTDFTGKSIAFNTAGSYEAIYTYTDSNNYSVDAEGNITTYSKTYTKTVHISVAVIEAAAKKAEFTMGSSNAATEKITVDNVTYISAKGVTADNSTWTYMTIGDQKIYYPIVAAKLTSTKGSSTYAYFPVFENVVTITDYANNGTGDAFTYNSSTTTASHTALPTAVKGVYKAASDVSYWYNLTNSNLSQSGASKIFKWASSSDAPSDPEPYNNVLCYKSPQISADRVAYITLVQYSYTDATNTTYYYYVGYTLEAFTKQTTCVTSDTLVTLADGTQKRIDQVTYEDQLLVWDFDKGEYTVANSSIIENHGYGYNTVIKLTFNDGTTIKAVNAHGFFDADLNKWVDITGENAENFIGHNFTQVNGDSYKTVKLVSAEVTTEYVEAWSILTADYYNCILEGMFSVTPPATEQLAFFTIGEDMKYDAEAKQADIEKYGLYTYDEFAHLMTEEQFEDFNIAEIKIAIGKGLITYEEVLELLATYA